MKRVCILTSGGDAPGMNQCVRAFVRAASSLDIEVLGVRDGFIGLDHEDFETLGRKSVYEWTSKGGTWLGTARYPEFMDQRIKEACAKRLLSQGIEYVVALGGDGTAQGCQGLTKAGLKTLLIPASIDNDVPDSEYALGFFTAADCIVESLDRLRDTMESHSHLFVVQTMGRYCGDLATWGGTAAGADIILTQQDNPSYEEVLERVRKIQSKGQRSCLIVVSEHLLDGEKLASDLETDTGWEARFNELGHIQRGGTTATLDRLMADIFGTFAARCVAENLGSGTIGILSERVVHTPFGNQKKSSADSPAKSLVQEAERRTR